MDRYPATDLRGIATIDNWINSYCDTLGKFRDLRMHKGTFRVALQSNVSEKNTHGKCVSHAEL
jgi:hypothetical protein